MFRSIKALIVSSIAIVGIVAGSGIASAETPSENPEQGSTVHYVSQTNGGLTCNSLWGEKSVKSVCFGTAPQQWRTIISCQGLPDQVGPWKKGYGIFSTQCATKAVGAKVEWAPTSR